MRLTINMQCNNFNLPLSYKHIIQATIYNMLSPDKQSSFYHDEGYKLKDKSYKMFVFSDLFGDYTINNKHIYFTKDFKLYVDSLDVEFTQALYDFLINNKYLYINKQRVVVSNVTINQTPVFKGIQSLTIQTLSPVVAYTSKNKYFTYYKPGDDKFDELVKNNIEHKFEAYKYPKNNIIFETEKVISCKKRISYFKNNFYESYITTMQIKVDYNSFKVLYETGMSSKGSCGFGMIFVK